MRFIVHGVGAIGGTLAAALAQSGQRVEGIARGRMLEAIRSDGLRLRTPAFERCFRLPVHADPSEIAFAPDDVVLLTVKSQDTAQALRSLRAAGLQDQPVFCLQNGINNEREALRLFPNVYGATVIMPSDYLVPGEVVCFSTPMFGMFDIGRFPGGLDPTAETVAAALEQAGFKPFLQDDVMRSKRGKLLENLANVIDAATGRIDSVPDVVARARAEAEAVFSAAGLDWMEVGAGDPRRAAVLTMGDVPGVQRSGSSSAQSLKRGTGSIETDFLNGEIVLLGRLHGVPTPVNWVLTRLSHRLIAENLAPGSIAPEEIVKAIVVAEG